MEFEEFILAHEGDDLGALALARDRYAGEVEDFDLAPVRESVAILLGGAWDYEFRTTVVAELHDEASFRGIGPWIRGAKRYFLQAFTDRDTVPFQGFHAPSPEEIRRWAKIMEEFVPSVALRGVE